MILIGKKLYADNFRFRSELLKELLDRTCQCCHRKEKTEYLGKKGKTCKIVLIAHHPNGDTENPDAELVILCRACHGKEQRLHNIEVWEVKKKDKLLTDIKDAKDNGQLQFVFDETEYTVIQIGFPITQFLQPISLT